MKIAKEVIAISSRSKGKNNWKVLTTKGTDGKTRDENLIVTGDRELQTKLEGVLSSPGKYEFEYTKNGDYWGIVGATKLSTSPAPETVPTTNNGNASKDTALLVAAQIVAALITSGKFSPSTPADAFQEVLDSAKIIYNTDLKTKE
ncbi:MAG: hypothetical protein AAB875_01980 [Patescibacteria group bacterium]